MRIENKVVIDDELAQKFDAANKIANFVYNWSLEDWLRRGGGDIKAPIAVHNFNQYKKQYQSAFEHVSSHVLRGAVENFVRDKNLTYSHKRGPLARKAGDEDMELVLAPALARIKSNDTSVEVPFYGELGLVDRLDSALVRSVSVVRKPGTGWVALLSMFNDEREVRNPRPELRDSRPGPVGKYGLEFLGREERKIIPIELMPARGIRGFKQYLANYHQRTGSRFKAKELEDGSIEVVRVA